MVVLQLLRSDVFDFFARFESFNGLIILSMRSLVITI